MTRKLTSLLRLMTLLLPQRLEEEYVDVRFLDDDPERRELILEKRDEWCRLHPKRHGGRRGLSLESPTLGRDS